VGNSGVGSSSTARDVGAWHAWGRDQARRDEAEWARLRMDHVAAQREMGVPPQGSMGQADGAVGLDEQSEELGISIGCRSVNGVHREESVDGLTSGVWFTPAW
jgi:hypothetical protein